MLKSKTILFLNAALLLLLSLFTISCSQLDSKKAVSAEYINGQKSAEIHAKQDAVDSRCINYPVALNSNVMNNISKHVSRLKKEKESDDFINGFCKSYQSEYREYMNLYCDNLDSSEKYYKE